MKYPSDFKTHVRTHRGIKIYRYYEMIPGSDFKVKVDGSIKDSKPKYEHWFVFGNKEMSAYYDSLSEIEEGIDRLYRQFRETFPELSLKELDEAFEEELNK